MLIFHFSHFSHFSSFIEINLKSEETVQVYESLLGNLLEGKYGMKLYQRALSSC